MKSSEYTANLSELDREATEELGKKIADAVEKYIIDELLDLILKWWKEHEYDTLTNEYDTWNVFDTEPEFVTMAKQIKGITKE